MTELRRFFIALGYFTRIPIPAWVGWSADELDRAARYFPLVGALVGAIAALALWLGAQALPLGVAVTLSMLATLLLTGAFHEDGLADAADGFGGGYTRERVLEIMKDSRIGSFGATALVMALLTKFAALQALATHDIRLAAVALVVAHPLSRLTALGIMAWLPYVREDVSARAKPVAQGIGRTEVAIGSFCVLLIMARASMWWLPWQTCIAALAIAAACAILCGAYFRRRIGGYTGDCLGATQQLCELSIHLVMCASLLP